MMKIKLQHLLIAFFGLALFACDNSDKEYIEPVPDLSDGLNSSQSGTEIDESDICGEPYAVPLNYGGGTAGEVTITNDNENLYVHIYSEDGFQDIGNNVALWVGTDLNELELNSYGIPLTSDSYQYLDEAEDTDFTFTIPLADVMGYDESQCGNGIIYVVTQVAALVSIDGSDVYVTGYGGNNLVDTSFPWWYDWYTPQCCEEEPPGDDTCETAYAKYPVEGDFGFGYVFASDEDANPEGHFSLELSNNKWGWAGRFTEDGSYDFDLWAAAGLNDTSKGTLVGTVTVEISGNDVKVTYNLMDDYAMSELHIYVSNDIPETTAPGQYGYTMEFDDPQTTHIANFTVDGEMDIWVIAHAVVCGDYPDDDEG